jgi:hypothetical protein
MLEAAATNLVTYSEDLSNAAWSKGLMTVTGGNLAPDGANSAYLVNTATETSATFPANSPVVANSTTYVLSVFVKAGTASHLRFRFGLAVGSVSLWYSVADKTFSNIGTGTTAVLVTSGFSGGWDRVSVSIAYGASDGGARSVAVSPVAASGSSVASGTVYLWGYQLEAGLFTTSYFPTTTTALTRATDVSTSAAVTRAVDVASIYTLSPWYNATEGTLFGQVLTPKGVVLFGTGTTFDNTQYAAVGTGNNIFIRSGGAVSANFSAPVTTTGQTKVAFVYKANDFAAASNGGAVATDTSGAVPVGQVRLKLGSSAWDTTGGNNINGYLQKIIYYPKRLTNSEIQALTS